jgi:hypothetical protein
MRRRLLLNLLPSTLKGHIMRGPEAKYGYGDEQTWGDYAGHPNDPRAVDDEEDDWEPDWEAVFAAREPDWY